MADKVGPAMLLLLTGLAVTSCSERRGRRQRWARQQPLPLPAWPERPADHLPYLLRESERCLQLAGPAAISEWRRLAWLQRNRGERDAALKALDQSASLLDVALTTVAQQTAERSALADQYVALQRPERARALFTGYRYQGTSPAASALLRRADLTAIEHTNLKAPEIFMAPRLLLALLDQGPILTLRRELQPRLDFALMRGPEGGRSERFHNAVLLQFHLSDPAVAMKATEQQSPPERLRTLGCLLFGGTMQVSTILYQRDRYKLLESRLTPALRQSLIQRLIRTLHALVPQRLLDLELTALAALALQLSARPLAELALARLSNPETRTVAFRELEAGTYLRLPSPPKNLSPIERSSFLSRNLGKIMGVADPRYQAMLLTDFIEELKTPRDFSLFAGHATALCWEHQRTDLLERLMERWREPAYLCHQQLKQGMMLQKRGERSQAEALLVRTLPLLPTIAKQSHRLQETLRAVDLARALGERTLLSQLRDRVVELTPQTTISALRTEALIYLASLHYEFQDIPAYQNQYRLLEVFDEDNPFEEFERNSRLQRLALALIPLGGYERTVEILSKLSSPLAQAVVLLELGEHWLKIPPMPTYNPTASLQNGQGGGRGLPSPLR